MKNLLCFLAATLPLVIYPKLFSIPPELTSYWGNTEIDLMNWYKMLFIFFIGLPGLLFLKNNRRAAFVLFTFLLSTIFSEYPELSVYGTPERHEGLLAFIGYLGIFLIAKRTGVFRGLELCFSFVIVFAFYSCVLQFFTNHFLDFFPFNLYVPTLPHEHIKFPLFGIFANPNHLGLFCSLFLPYTTLKRNWFLSSLLFVMLFGSEFRSAWVSVLFVLFFISKRIFYASLALLFVFVLIFYKETVPKLRQIGSELHIPVRDADLSGRIFMWKEAIKRLPHDMVIGDGAASYPLYVDHGDKSNQIFTGAVVDRPHNMILSVWQSFGFPSLVILFFIVLIGLYEGTSLSLKYGVTSFLITGLFTDSVLSVTPYFLMFLGGLHYEYDRKKQ